MTLGHKKIYLMVCSEVPGLKRQDWLDQMPELSILADIEPVFVFNQPSADMTPDVWIKLAEEIYRRMDSAVGFVVFHGIDNLLYTSSALSFLLQNLAKPVIFTGGQLEPGDTRRLDVKANLINACQAANFNVPEVSIMFGNRLIRANQASRSLDGSLNVFVTPPNGILGKIDFSIRMYDKVILKSKGKTKLFDRLNSKIEVVDLSPVQSVKSVSKRLTDREGVVVNADRFQYLPHDLMFFLHKITDDVPVMVWSRQLTASALAPQHILLVNNMTLPATVTKLMWVLTQSNDIDEIKDLMSRDIAGEIIA